MNSMVNVIDMRDFDCMFDNLEEYFNKHGYTLGNDADRLQELMHCIQYCYIHGVATGSQIESMKKKFRKQVSGSLKELDNVKNGCIRGRRLTDKEYKEMLFREQVKETRSGKIEKEYLMIADLMEYHFASEDSSNE